LDCCVIAYKNAIHNYYPERKIHNRLKIIKEWRETRHGNIPRNRNFNMDTVLFADDQVLIAKSESDLQYSVHNLNKIAAKYSLEINIEKTKVMAFKGREPVRSKICINNKTLEQVNAFNYLGYFLC
jgi:hypothetical protein